MTLTPWIFFIIGFPNPVFTDHPANLSVHPDSEVKEDKINPPNFYILFTIIHDFSHVNIFFHFFLWDSILSRSNALRGNAEGTLCVP